MKYIFCLLLFLLVGCEEKELTPVGSEYRLTYPKAPISITLTFSPDGRFYGKAVNDYWGQYHIHDNVISFSGITSTMKTNILPKMRAEKAYFDSLTRGHTFKIEKGKLSIFFDENGILEFQN